MLPREFGPWQSVHRRHQKWSQDGTWDRVLAALQAEAETAGEIDWRVSVDSTISRVHQHGATAARSTSGPLSAHRGLGGMTRIHACGRTNRTITPSVARAAV
jgi:transposase